MDEEEEFLPGMDEEVEEVEGILPGDDEEQNEEMQLRDIVWDIRDVNLTRYLEIEESPVGKDEFLRKLSEKQMEWNTDMSEIVFLYPITGKSTLDTEIDELLVNPVIYLTEDLPTALEVIGAISTYYNQNISPSISNVDDEIHTEYKILITKYLRYKLLTSTDFAGIKKVSENTYLIKFVGE